jgi:hypothetical protein
MTIPCEDFYDTLLFDKAGNRFLGFKLPYLLVFPSFVECSGSIWLSAIHIVYLFLMYYIISCYICFKMPIESPVSRIALRTYHLLQRVRCGFLSL